MQKARGWRIRNARGRVPADDFFEERSVGDVEVKVRE